MKFESGQMVRIKSTIVTRERIGLDSDGIMKSMVGKVFQIKSLRSNRRVYIRSPKGGFDFTWDTADFEAVEVKEPDPVIFEFDPKHLDI